MSDQQIFPSEKTTTFSIRPGAGGQESVDFARILKDMYVNWATRNAMNITASTENGITWTLQLKWDSAIMEQEHGIHRLVRISPFDEQKRRHTSFAAVDVDGIKSADDEEHSIYGKPIRNYILHPYQQAKDMRKNYTTEKVDDVLAGGVELDKMRSSGVITLENTGPIAIIESRTLTQEEKDYALTLQVEISQK